MSAPPDILIAHCPASFNLSSDGPRGAYVAGRTKTAVPNPPPPRPLTNAIGTLLSRSASLISLLIGIAACPVDRLAERYENFSQTKSYANFASVLNW
jgi:hypothetical protein